MHNPPHPGEIIKTLCLEPLGLTVTQAAQALGVSRKTLSAILNGRAGMQKTETLDLCLVLEGEVTLVLDTVDVPLKAGDTVVQRATRHAWSNVSKGPAIVAVSSHDARA
jgi:addiction module HigA family antidote